MYADPLPQDPCKPGEPRAGALPISPRYVTSWRQQILGPADNFPHARPQDLPRQNHPQPRGQLFSLDTPWSCDPTGLGGTARRLVSAKLWQGDLALLFWFFQEHVGEWAEQRNPRFHTIGLIFFSAGEKRIKLQDSFNIFTILKLKLSSRLHV